MLNVVSILLIIFSVPQVFNSTMEVDIISLIVDVTQLIMGIFGVSASSKPKKAGACIVWGIVAIVLVTVSTIPYLGDPSATGGAIYKLVLPILYLIGAYQLRQKSIISESLPTEPVATVGEVKKSKMLKVIGILMIIFSAFELVSAFGPLGEDIVSLVNRLLILITGALKLTAGILGVTSFDKPEKADRCWTFSVITIVFSAITTIVPIIITVLQDSFSPVITIILAVFSLTLPILYTIGAYRFKYKQ
jgi:hypothetical protein